MSSNNKNRKGPDPIKLKAQADEHYQKVKDEIYAGNTFDTATKKKLDDLLNKGHQAGGDANRSPYDSFGFYEEARKLLAKEKGGTDPDFKSRVGVEKMYETLLDTPGSKQTNMTNYLQSYNKKRG